MRRIITTCILFFLVYFLSAQSFNGFALYNAQGSNTTYLIDENMQIAHTWNMTSECNYTVQLKKNGNLIRGTKNSGNILGGAAEGGKVQEIAPDGSIVWEYVYSNADHLSHHDLTLIGDNVLLTAWEVKTASEVSNAGYTGNIGNSGKWPTHFIELEYDGNSGANIVWEWHIWDHLCQDVDPNKPNYTSNISDHPELIDVNMIQGGGGQGGGQSGDWFHVNGVDYNGVDYNEDLDQIAFSSRFASEIYIIDHSTTTAEAASHTGGNSGMGGDILYRWGNPSNYGIPGQQVIPNAVHDVRWIEDDGRPNGGYLQIFNNSGISNNQSAVDGIETAIDPNNPYNYLRTSGQAFGPSSYTTRNACQYNTGGVSTNCSASGQSASDRMTNGNIFINASGGQNGCGSMYEVDGTGSLVWGPYAADAQKGFRYECDYEGIQALESYMNNTSSTSCFNQTDIKNIFPQEHFTLFPNPSNRFLNIEFNGVLKSICIYNFLGEKILENTSLFNQNTIKFDLQNYEAGLYMIRAEDNSGNHYSQVLSYTK